MTRRREGTLDDGPTINVPRGLSWEEVCDLAGSSIVDMDDFMRKAEKMAAQFEQRGRVAQERARRLRRELRVMQAALAHAANEIVTPAQARKYMWATMGASLLYGRLLVELLDDKGSKLTPKLTRGNYMQQKRSGKTQEDIAAHFRVSRQYLLKWRRENFSALDD